MPSLFYAGQPDYIEKLNTLATAASMTNGTVAASFLSLAVTGTATAASFVGPLTGNASTATALATARAINGVNFDGTAAITVTAAAGTLSGTTLAANVVNASLNSITPAGGTLGVSGSIRTSGPAEGLGVQNDYALVAFYTGAGTRGAYIQSTLTEMSFWNERNTPVLFAQNNTEYMRATGGNLLIGQTANPGSYKLAVTGNVGITGSISATGLVTANTLRVNVTPTAEVVVATHTAVFNINGTNYKFLCLAA